MSNSTYTANTLSPQLTEELKQILEEDFGIRLPLTEVSKIGETLKSYFDLLLKINYENNKKESTNG